MTMTNLSSLTWDEAKRRAELVDVHRYDIDIDLTELVEGGAFRAVSTIRFGAPSPGSPTFVDCACEVISASLNGQPLVADAVTADRIRLDDLADENVLVVETVQRSTHQATGVHRSVDPADGEVYIWTSFEPDDARRVWACFDQPDLKAPFGFTVTAPAGWTVLSNSGDPTVVDRDGVQHWTFPDTPPLSTYVPVVNAGPFHEIRVQRDGFDLGLYARRSLAAFLERDADELFDLTAAGMAFFGERFAMPFPQRRYDQVFVPDMGGAMENWGCITWSDAYVYRAEPSPAERELRGAILLHEMAHMWFGDLVTMRWWDDLWLNEAFAEWAAHWAATSATQFGDAWASFLARQKVEGYRADRAPTSHAIRQPAPDVAQATAGFDAITYAKGASVLKQLVAYVGEDAFVAGLRSYFVKYAYANAGLADLMGELALSSDRDLDAWTRGWLDTAGTDTLALEPTDEAGLGLRAIGPAGGDPRPHRVDVGAYDRGDGALVCRATISLETTGDVTPVPDGDRRPYLLLVNDDDLTFAHVRPDPESLARLLESAGALPTSTGRAVAVATAWNLLATGDVSAADLVRCVTGVLATESADTVVEPFLGLALQAAELWTPEDDRDGLLSQIADSCQPLAAGSGARRRVATRALARSATTDEQLATLRELAADDVDLGWRALTRLAALGRYDQAAATALAERDPDPDAWVRVLAVESARPTTAAKETAWRAVIEEHRVPVGSLYDVATAFWQPSQPDVLAPFAERYLDMLPTIGRGAMIPAMAAAQTMFPWYGVDRAFVDRVVAAATDDAVTPIVSARVREGADQLRRMLAARG
jgi:aminopeptidase N